STRLRRAGWRTSPARSTPGRSRWAARSAISTSAMPPVTGAPAAPRWPPGRPASRRAPRWPRRGRGRGEAARLPLTVRRGRPMLPRRHRELGVPGDPADFDLFLVGGGINGCGIARDAAGRGLRVGLAEAGDLAQATSSASTKLFHGGLRYLEYYE